MQGYVRIDENGTGVVHFHDATEAEVPLPGTSAGRYRCTAQYGTDGWSVRLGKRVSPREEVSRLQKMAAAGGARSRRHQDMARKISYAAQLARD